MLDYFNLVFTYIFIGEMALKFLVLGPFGYLGYISNFFDFLIVSFSIMDIVLESRVSDGGGTGRG